MAITRILINGKFENPKEFYKTIDLSEPYADELDNFETTSLTNEDMVTFLRECLDEEVDFVWEMIKAQHNCDDMHLIDFDSSYLHDDHKIEVKLSDDLSVIATVNIKFEIDYYLHNSRYNDGTGCYHKYRAYSVAVGDFVRIDKTKNLEVA